MTPRHLLEPARLAGGAILRAQSDSRLVDMTRAGNDRAFEAIVARYKGDLLRYCSRVLLDGRGEDAVQQVFVNAYGALHRETTPLSLRSWLFGIAHNVSLNILRQRGSDHAPLEAHGGTEEPAHVTHERRERLREVLAAVAALPPGQRDAIVLRELEGRGHDDIARELGVTGGAARQLISRARDGVRRAAAALFPMPLLMRLTDDAAPAPTLERIAELTAVGGGVTVGKVVATAAIGGTLMGGAATGPDLVSGDKDRRAADVAEAAVDTGDTEDEDTGDSSGPGSGDGDGDGDGADNSGPGSGDDEEDDDRSGSNSGPGDGDGDDGDDDLEDNSGPGEGEPVETDSDNSGPGSVDEPDDDNSGPGDGDDDMTEILEPDGEADNSGSGSDSSGSGSDGDDTIDVDNSGSGSSG
jgi:RNA polymerase sigma factor (sigma-70 family)